MVAKGQTRWGVCIATRPPHPPTQRSADDADAARGPARSPYTAPPRAPLRPRRPAIRTGAAAPTITPADGPDFPAAPVPVRARMGGPTPARAGGGLGTAVIRQHCGPPAAGGRCSATASAAVLWITNHPSVPLSLHAALAASAHPSPWRQRPRLLFVAPAPSVGSAPKRPGLRAREGAVCTAVPAVYRPQQ